MNKYRVFKVDLSRPTNHRVIRCYIVDGLANARKSIPVKIGYSRNTHTFVGYNGNIEYRVCKIE